MHPMLSMARRAAEEASKIIWQGVRQIDAMPSEGRAREEVALSTQKRAQAVIEHSLREKYPNHQFISEDKQAEAFAGILEAEAVWLINGLEGRANFTRGFAHFAISIALLKRGKPEIGLVLNPVSGECFSAVKGQGARRDNYRLRVSEQRDIQRAVVALGGKWRDKEQGLPKILANWTQLVEVRRLGASALDLCFVACARQDAFLATQISARELAAAVLIAREAGVIVSDFSGNTEALVQGEVIASNAFLHNVLLKELAQLRRGE